jgi:hypothetical protein
MVICIARLLIPLWKSSVGVLRHMFQLHRSGVPLPSATDGKHRTATIIVGRFQKELVKLRRNRQQLVLPPLLSSVAGMKSNCRLPLRSTSRHSVSGSRYDPRTTRWLRPSAIPSATAHSIAASMTGQRLSLLSLLRSRASGRILRR